MKKIVAKQIFSFQAELGEGPVWDVRINRLWWVDITQGHLHRFNPVTGVDEKFQLGISVGAVVPVDDGEVIVVVRNGFARYNTIRNTLEMLAVVEHKNSSIRFNDAKCDSMGRLWAGTLAEDGATSDGKLFTLEHDLSVVCKIDNVGISNGIAWSPSGDTMYYIDSMSQKVVAYRYDSAHGTITDKKVIVEIDSKEGTPDGMCIDKDGMLWVALWDGGKVICIHPLSGERLCEVVVPNVQKVTSCTFGGENMNTLFITTARQGLTEKEIKEQPMAGSIFVADVGVTGLVTFKYKEKTV